MGAYQGKTGVTRVRARNLVKGVVWAILFTLLTAYVPLHPRPRAHAAPVPSNLAGFKATVVGDVCNVRSGPDTTYKVIGQVTMGTTVDVLSYENNWAKIKTGSLTGYIAGWLIDVDLGSKGVSARITATDVNVREGPGTSYRVKTMTDRDKVYPAEVKRGAWIRVTLTSGGSTGWISETLLKLEFAGTSEPQSPPQTQPQPPLPSETPKPPVQTGLVVYPARDTLTIYSNAIAGSSQVARLSKGESARVVGAEGAYIMVETSNGLRGWVYGPHARVASLGDPSVSFIVSQNTWVIGKYPVSTVTATDVNFRSGPGTNYPVIESLDKGDTLWVLGTSGEWKQAISPVGQAGWVAGWLTSPTTSAKGTAFTVSASANGEDRTLTVTGPFESAVVIPSPDKSSVIVSTSIFFNTSVELPVNAFEFGTIKVATSDVTVNFQGKANYDIVEISPGKVVLRFTPVVTSLDVRSSGNTDILTINTVGYAWADVRRDGDVVTLFLPGASLANELPSLKGRTVKNVTVSPRDGGVDVAIKTSGQLAYQIKQTANSIQATFGVSGLEGKRIVVDPGHEANDPGAIGPTGLAERNVNWEMAVRLAELLNQAGATAILTRQSLYANSEGPPGWVPKPGEYSHSLSERAAWSQGADLFISIHNNWNYDRSISGTTVYVCDKNPNASESRRFASMALSELTLSLGTRDMGVRDSNFHVCREALCPAVLVEVMFLSNPIEESYLRQSETWAKTAQSLFRAVQRYFGTGSSISTPGI
jgi:N-acetylmuramoyl-L-alanine amidase